MNDHNNRYENLVKKNIELAGTESTFFAAHKAQIIQELVDTFSYSPSSILDFGCSDGLLTSFIQAIFTHAQVIGIDQSGEHIEVARLIYAPITFAVITTKIPASNATYDLVIASDVFHHINKHEHTHYVQEIMRVLKPGGLCIVLELNPLNLYTALNFNRNPLEKNVHMLNHWYTRKLLKHYGPVVTRFHYSFPKGFFRLNTFLTRIPFGALYTGTVTKQPH